MVEKNVDLRKIMSMNIKKLREEQGISQEMLAEKAGISTNMVKDIEGCRTWVSDKTLIKLAFALNTDIYRLFISSPIHEDELYKTVIFELVKTIQKIKKDVDVDFEKTLKLLEAMACQKLTSP